VCPSAYGRPLKGFPFRAECYCSAEGTDQKLTNVSHSEATLEANAHARGHDNPLARIAPSRDDNEVPRLRELSMDYIREAERFEQISAALDAIAATFLLLPCKISQKSSPSTRRFAVVT